MVKHIAAFDVTCQNGVLFGLILLYAGMHVHSQAAGCAHAGLAQTAHCMCLAYVCHCPCFSAADAIQQNEFADLYSEVGPDNVGGMGSEPSCTLTLFTCQPGAAQSPSNGPAAPSQATEAVHSPSRDKPATFSSSSDAPELQAVSADTNPPLGSPSDATAKVTGKTVTPASADGNNATALDSSNVSGSQASQPPKRQKVTAEKHAPFEAVMQIGCSPHNVVASRPGHQHPMLLGLSDDVDCAVVAVSAADAGQQLHAEHVHSIPALAYVAAGKP